MESIKYKVVVKKAISAKNNKPYFAIVLKMGYRDAFLNFDKYLCAEVLKMNIIDMYSLDDGEYDIE